MSSNNIPQQSSNSSHLDQDLLEVFEEKPNHHFRTEIPNILDELSLSPLAYRLYCKYKRIASDKGGCWYSNKNLADQIGVSENTLKKARDELSQNFSLLNDRPLIIKKIRYKPDGSRDTDRITIVDIWQTNGNYFRKGGGSNSDVPQNLREGGSKFEEKEEPIKKNHSLSVLSVSPAGDEKKSIENNQRIVVKSHKNPGIVTASKEQLYSDLQGKGCSTDEISAALEIIKDSDPKINTTIKEYAFGIIKKMRKEKAYESKSKSKSKEKKEEIFGKQETKIPQWIKEQMENNL